MPRIQDNFDEAFQMLDDAFVEVVQLQNKEHPMSPGKAALLAESLEQLRAARDSLELCAGALRTFSRLWAEQEQLT